MGEQLTRVRALIAAEPDAVDAADGMVGVLDRLCRAAVRALPGSGAGLSLLTGQGGGGVAAASDGASRALAELQFALGEGPSVGG
ncbi:MAG: hypothetical protein ACRDP1_02235 [Nocardioidaceae bacterium]